MRWRTDLLLFRKDVTMDILEFNCLNLRITCYSVRTAQETHSVSVIQPSQLMLYREIIAVCSQIHTKHINTLCGQNVECVTVKHNSTFVGFKRLMDFVFRAFQKCADSLPHVSPSATTRGPLNGLPWNWMLKGFTKNLSSHTNFGENRATTRDFLHWDLRTYLGTYECRIRSYHNLPMKRNGDFTYGSLLKILPPHLRTHYTKTTWRHCHLRACALLASDREDGRPCWSIKDPAHYHCVAETTTGVPGPKDYSMTV